jgi:hypothetical protein
MNKKLKEKIIAHHEEMKAAFPTLYERDWVEKAADEGWERYKKSFMKSIPEGSSDLKGTSTLLEILAVVYYTSFEDAINTFFFQVLEDEVTNIQLTMNELQKVTAEMKNIAEEE